MQLKNEDQTYPIVIETILNPVETILQLQFYTDNEATGITQTSLLPEIDEDPLICPVLSTT